MHQINNVLHVMMRTIQITMSLVTLSLDIRNIINTSPGTSKNFFDITRLHEAGGISIFSHRLAM